MRQTAAKTLGKFPAHIAVPLLINFGFADPDSRVRDEAVSSVRKIASVRDLNKALDSYDRKVRRTAAAALGNFVNGQALTALEAHRNDSDAGVHKTVEKAIASLRAKLAELERDRD